MDYICYIKSNRNPVEALTRVTELQCLADWLEGPSFLQLPDTNWPKFEVEEQGEETEAIKEMKPPEKANMSMKHKVALTRSSRQIRTSQNRK